MESKEATKIVVIGGAGQAGKIHVTNLINLGAEVASFDVVENQKAAKNYDAKTAAHSECVNDGFDVALVALPDHMLFDHTMKIIDAGFKRIMVEKPGSQNSEQIKQLVDKAENKGVTMYINYQRQFDQKAAALLSKISDLSQQGYVINYVSVYSCDKDQPPQAAPQYLNQGCHDYAILLGILEANGMTPKDIQARGVEWKGHAPDTMFLKVTGQAQNPSGEQALYDVQMGRVNSTGTFTEIYVKMARYNAANDMYEPYEEKLKFPEVDDPNAHWSDVWGAAFIKSAEALKTGQNGVPLSFGIKVLSFAENIGQSLNEGSSVVKLG